MAGYGWCYNSTGSKCSGKAQPGTLALRKAIRELFPGIGDLGIYNCRPSSGGGGLSTHGEGRGWDAACNATTSSGLALGNKLAASLVVHAQDLGIQRVIWNRRQWDSRNRTWRQYNGSSPHRDHLHIELCWASARDRPLTVSYVKSVFSGGQEDELTPEDKKWIKEMVESTVKKYADPLWKALYKMRPGSDPAQYDEHLNLIEEKIDKLGT